MKITQRCWCLDAQVKITISWFSRMLPTMKITSATSNTTLSRSSSSLSIVSCTTWSLFSPIFRYLGFFLLPSLFPLIIIEIVIFCIEYKRVLLSVVIYFISWKVLDFYFLSNCEWLKKCFFFQSIRCTPTTGMVFVRWDFWMRHDNYAEFLIIVCVLFI